jgi:diguanylate cyclase (GGDEF)-like protein
MQINSIPLFMMASICFYVCLYYLVMFLRRPKEKINLIFSITCLLIGSYDFFSAGLYNAPNIIEGMFWQRLQLTNAGFLGIPIMWFTYFITGFRFKKTIIILSLVFAISSISGLFIHNDLTLSLDYPSIKNITIGNIHIVYNEVNIGLFYQLQFFFASAVFLFLMIVLTQSFIKGDKKLLPIIFSMGIYFAAIINDTLVASTVYSFIYISEYAFMTIIISMAYVLLHQFIDLHHEIETLNVSLENKIKKRTSDLEKANEQLKSLDIMKNDFIANITHDFRSPLTVVLNMSEIALNYDQPKEELIKGFDLIYKSGMRLKHSIDRLLDLAKMDAQGVKLFVTPIKLKDFIQEISNYYKSATSKMGIRFHYISPEKEIENFYSDKGKLEQILNNIISNSMKFTDPELGEITILLEDLNDAVRITVSDNGIGIEQDRLKSIFNRFEHSNRGLRNTRHKGTGIGLSFSKQLTNYIQGEIRAESNGQDKGSSFILEMKKGNKHFKETDFNQDHYYESFREGIKKVLSLEADEHSEKSGYTLYFSDYHDDEINYDIKKSVILVVDDDSSIRKIIYQYLSLSGYQNIIMATDGKYALEAANKIIPDLIISDYNMPNMDGEALQTEISKIPHFSQTPFIFLSAIADKNIILQRKQAGAIEYLTKPIDRKEFLIAVESNLNKFMNFKKTLSQSYYDDLTQLFNKRQFFNLLRDEILKKGSSDLSLIFFDIDHFKKFNDTYGHQFGDEILRMTGMSIKKTIRSSDIPARYGGEEFVILLPNTSTAGALAACKKLQNSIILQTVENDADEGMHITASFGIANQMENQSYILSELGIDDIIKISEAGVVERFIELFLKMSDQAMYNAKKTTCLSCGFSSEKDEVFENAEICPNCKGNNLDRGRDRIMIYRGQ